MTVYNLNAGYGLAQVSGAPFTTGKVFVVSDSTDSNFSYIDQLFIPDGEGVARRYSTFAAALAACTAGHGDIVVRSPGFTTALTAAELLEAETKGVVIYNAGQADPLSGSYKVERATAALPQSTQEALFTVTGRVQITSILGEVTTVIQTQANNTKLVVNPTIGSDVDLSAVTDITGDVVGTNYGVTGVFTDALVAFTGASAAQVPFVVAAGTLDLSCAASNTGSVKWVVEYLPLDAGALVVAA